MQIHYHIKEEAGMEATIPDTNLYGAAKEQFTKYSDDIQKIMEQIDRNWKNLNIMIMGQSGVGKSTLSNAMFGQNMAETGIGKPVTTGIQKYTQNGYTLYDTAGIEPNSFQQNELIRSICSFIRSQSTKGISEHIHMIWYCINASSSRLHQVELELLHNVSNAIKESMWNIPVIFVITKPFSVTKKDLNTLTDYIRSQVKDLFPGSENRILPVQAINYSVDFGPQVVHIERAGLLELNNAVCALLPDTLHDSWVRICAVNLDAKVSLAKKILAKETVAVGCITASATALSLDDTIPLLFSEIYLFAKIGSVFNFKVDFHRTVSNVSSTIGILLTGTISKSLLNLILSIITSGVTKLVEGVIRLTVTESVVTTLGLAYIELMKRYSTKDLSYDETTKAMEAILVETNTKKAA